MNKYIWSEDKSFHMGVLFKFRRVGQLAPGVASSYSLRPVVGWVVSSLKAISLLYVTFKPLLRWGVLSIVYATAITAINASAGETGKLPNLFRMFCAFVKKRLFTTFHLLYYLTNNYFTF